MLPLDKYPDWIRPFEKRRRNAGISGRELSRECGFSDGFWVWLSKRHSPPGNWNRLELKINRVLSKLEREV